MNPTTVPYRAKSSKKTILVCLLLSLIAFQPLSSQSLKDALKKSMKEAFGNSNKDKPATSSSDENYDEEEMGKMMDSVFSAYDEEYVPSPNTFIGSMTATMSNDGAGKAKRASDMDLEYHFLEWKTAMKMTDNKEPNNKHRMIVDRKEGTMTTLIINGTEKTGIKMPIPGGTIQVSDDPTATESTYDDVKITPTNETKMIAGYQCTKYLVSSDDGQGEMWLAKNVGIQMHELFGFMKVDIDDTRSAMAKPSSIGFQGFPMETIFTTTKGETSSMLIHSLSTTTPPSAPFETTGYEVTDMSGFMGGR